MMPVSASRWDETWHRLREWTSGQGPSERLAAIILSAEGFTQIDPAHPLGGKDGGQDAACVFDGKRYTMAVYFPRGQQSDAAIRSKFLKDAQKAVSKGRAGIAFVTNQELRLSLREKLRHQSGLEVTELFHLERLTTILDRPQMVAVRKQFLGLAGSDDPAVALGGAGGQAPGAGGGGGGAIGPGARGGDGGGGGEIVFGFFDAASLPDVVPVVIGKRGEGGAPGEDGEDGGDTTFGDLLRARGGKGGRSGRSTNEKKLSARDLRSGFRVLGIYLADCVHERNGLLDLLSAGWALYETSKPNVEVPWPLACTILLDGLSIGDKRELVVLVRNPNGLEIKRERLIVTRSSAATVNIQHHLIGLSIAPLIEGVWNIAVESGSIILATLPIEVRHRR
jgi:hypothetical protein